MELNEELIENASSPSSNGKRKSNPKGEERASLVSSGVLSKKRKASSLESEMEQVAKPKMSKLGDDEGWMDTGETSAKDYQKQGDDDILLEVESLAIKARQYEANIDSLLNKVAAVDKELQDKGF